jgi:hypothetical protein
MQQTSKAVDDRQFWVIGAEFRDTAFRAVSGTPSAEGPFMSYDEALRIWRARSEETRHEAFRRFTIASNPAA